MSKVFGVHEVELRPDVDPADYERFFAEEIVGSPMPPGWRVRLLKSDRGERAGKYLVLLEIESVEARDRYFPGPLTEESEEVGQFMERYPAVAAAWEKKEGIYESEVDHWSDYVVIAE